jgi:hypothetical protein
VGDEMSDSREIRANNGWKGSERREEFEALAAHDAMMIKLFLLGVVTLQSFI